MSFSFFSARVLKKCWRAQFYLKMAKVLTRFFGDLSFQFQRPQWTGVDFPATSFYPWIKCVFLLQSVRVFSKNADVAQFYLKMANALTLSLGWFILSISMPTMDRGRYSRHFRLSVDKMCFSFFSLWEFSQKMLTCTILSQNGEGPEPIFLVIYTFNFNAHNGPGSIFPHFLLSIRLWE